MSALLSIQDLKVAFRMGRVDGQMQRQLAVKGVSFDLPENSTVALVGESGSGKSVTAMSVLNLLPSNAERSGRILFQGRDLLQAGLPELQALRGKDIACVFQDPMSSLNPVFNVATQICEPLIKHMGLSRRQALVRAEELLHEVGIPEPKRRLSAYPHEMSGGQQQRVMIAVALACSPKLLIADEPTTALDVTIQAQIMALLLKLQREQGMGLVMITHDLAVVAEMAQRVAVMYAGQVVETGPVPGLFDAPRHPYTNALLAAIPEHNRGAARLSALPGIVPGALDRPVGCLLSPRCPRVQPRCASERPPLEAGVRCFFPVEEAAHV